MTRLDRGTAPVIGVQFHGMWSNYTDEDRKRVLNALADAGVDWVRIDLSWAMLQPVSAASHSEWGTAFADRVIQMAHRRGMRILVTFWLTPDWANGGAGARSAPNDPNDYAKAVGWAAARYAEEVDAWEIWNEPNNSGFWEGADPAAYTKLLQAAYPAIKEANPKATVVFGGTSHNDAEWIEAAYQAGAGGSFDAMATHPYQAVADLEPEAPDQGDKWRLTHLTAVRGVMVRNGDGDKPIWATEFGWSSHGDDSAGLANWERGVTPEQQGDYLIRSLRLVQYRFPYVTHMFWYRDRDEDSGDPQSDNYGLLDANLNPKPALIRLRSELGDAGL